MCLSVSPLVTLAFNLTESRRRKTLTISSFHATCPTMCGGLLICGVELLDRCLTVGLSISCSLLQAILKGKRNRRGRHIIWMVVVWVLWITCNNSIFNGANVDLVDVVAKIKVLSWKWFANRKGRQCGVLYSEWCSNPVGCIMKRD